MLGTSKKQHDFAKIAQYPCLRPAAVPLWWASIRGTNPNCGQVGVAGEAGCIFNSYCSLARWVFGLNLPSKHGNFYSAGNKIESERGAYKRLNNNKQQGAK